MKVSRMALTLGDVRVLICRTLDSTADMIQIESAHPFGLSINIQARRVDVVDSRPKPKLPPRRPTEGSERDGG